MKKYISGLKVLINQIYFAVFSYLIAVSIMTLWRLIGPEPGISFLSLLFHLVEIIIIIDVVKSIMRFVPDAFDEPFVRDYTFISGTVLLFMNFSSDAKSVSNFISQEKGFG